MAATDLQISENSFLVKYFDMVSAKLYLVWGHFQHWNPAMPFIIKFSFLISIQSPAFGGEMNMYHRSFLCWQLYRTETCESSAGIYVWRTGNSLFYGHQRPQLLRKKQIEDKVTCTLNSLLCCRLRDGYLIKRVSIRDDFLEICFILPWKSHVYLEYLATTPWPSKSLPVSNTIQYTITIEGEILLNNTLTRLRVSFI